MEGHTLSVSSSVREGSTREILRRRVSLVFAKHCSDHAVAIAPYPVLFRNQPSVILFAFVPIL